MELQDTGSLELDVTQPVNAMVDRLIKRRILEAVCADESNPMRAAIESCFRKAWDEADKL